MSTYITLFIIIIINLIYRIEKHIVNIFSVKRIIVLLILII